MRRSSPNGAGSEKYNDDAMTDDATDLHSATDIVVYEPGYDGGARAEPGTYGDWTIFFDNANSVDVIGEYFTLPGRAGELPSAIEGLPSLLLRHGLKLASEDPWISDCPGEWSATVHGTVDGLQRNS
jgi:hypothetical protein